MTQKQFKPKVNLPGPLKVMTMLSPKRDGKTDHVMRKAFCTAIYEFERHRASSLRKMNKDTTTED